MQKIKIATLALFNLSFVFNGIACAAMSSGSGLAGGSEEYISICQVLKHEDMYLGKQIRFRATLETDYSNYGYFEDNPRQGGECAKNSILPIASISVMRDGSVIRFIQSNRDYCREHNMTLCVISVDVDFEARLLIDDDGPYLFMTKVFSYNYNR